MFHSIMLFVILSQLVPYAATTGTGDRIQIDAASLNTKLAVTESLPRISADDIWQTGPYCGANCLYVLLALANKEVRQADIRREMPITGNGANMLDLKRGAQKHGVSLEVLETTPSQLAELGFPLIALIGTPKKGVVEGHYVVVCQETDLFYEAIDGITGNLDRYSKDFFKRHFSGYVLARKPTVALGPSRHNTIDACLFAGCAVLAIVVAALTLIRRQQAR